MPQAIIAGVIAAVGGIAAAKIGSNATSKAVTAQTAAADQSNALQSNIYGQNKAALAPYVNTGVQASGAINALLGLGGSQQQQMPQQQTPQQQSYPAMTPDAAYGQDQGFDTQGQFVPQMQGGAMGGDPMQNPMQAQNDAFANFRNSTGYQFRLGEGMNALNSGYAGAGVLQSGSALKGITKYGQDYASNEFGNYMGALGNQQGVGLTAASAQAGVGTNYANSLSQINQNRADAIGNGALVNARNTGQLINTFGQIGSNILGNKSAAQPYVPPAATGVYYDPKRQF